MNETSSIDAVKAGKLAQEIVALLHNEDSEMRRRAVQSAMISMGEEAIPTPDSSGQSNRPAAQGDDVPDLGGFFSRDDKSKPSDYALLCAAYRYASQGPVAFSIDDIRDLAAEAGVVVPDRLDMTFRQASHSGKKLFQPAGRGMFKPTASAGIAFKEKWNVKPGKVAKARS